MLLLSTTIVYVSVVSAAELARLCKRDRVDLGIHRKPWFTKALALNGWQVLPVNLNVIEEAYSLPENFHTDPADRMMEATARKDDLTALTTNRKILDYPHMDASWWKNLEVFGSESYLPTVSFASARIKSS